MSDTYPAVPVHPPVVASSGNKVCGIFSADGAQSMIEFALTLPVLLLVAIGIVTFGVALNNYLNLTEATSAGARQMAISRGQGGDPCVIGANSIAAAAPLLNNGGSSGIGYTFTVNGTNYTGNPPTCANASFNQGDPIVLSVTYPCTLKVMGMNFVPSCFLKAQTTMVIQ